MALTTGTSSTGANAQNKTALQNLVKYSTAQGTGEDTLNNLLKQQADFYNDPLRQIGTAFSGVNVHPDVLTWANRTPQGEFKDATKTPMGMLAGIGAGAKGFIDAYNAAKGGGQMAVGDVMAAKSQGEQIQFERKKAENDMIDKVLTRYEANQDVKDETSRAQAIAQIETTLNDEKALLNNKFGGATVAKLFAQAVRPEMKRMMSEGDSNVTSLSALAGMLANEGYKNAGEVANKLLNSTGIITPEERADYLRILQTLKNNSKSNFSNAVTPYVNLLKRQGLDDETIKEIIRTPTGYSYSMPNETEGLP